MNTKTIESVSSMASIQQMASHYADVFAADPAAMASLELIIEAQEEVKMGPLNLERHFVRVFGDDLKAFPVPDSFGGNNPDKYSLPGKKNAKGSFYADLFYDLPVGKALKTDLEGIALALKNDPATPAKYKTFSGGVVALDKEKKKLTQRAGSGARAVRMAMAFHFQVERLKDFDTIALQVTYPEESVQTYPVAIFNRVKMTEFKVFSIGALLSLDLDAAEDKGGSYEDVYSSTKRSAAPPDGESSIKNLDGFEAAGADLLNYLEKIAGEPKIIGALYKKLQDPANDHFLKTVFGIAEELDKIVSKPDLAKRYANLQARTSHDGKASAA